MFCLKYQWSEKLDISQFKIEYLLSFHSFGSINQSPRMGRIQLQLDVKMYNTINSKVISGPALSAVKPQEHKPSSNVPTDFKTNLPLDSSACC